MHCSKCGTQMSIKTRYCSSCGQRTKLAARKRMIIITILMALICITVFILLGSHFNQLNSKQEAAVKQEKQELKEEKVEQTNITQEKEIVTKKQKLAETPKDVSEMIQTSQPRVFTIFTELGQGSGFLINKKGDVLTNAHVVEGSLKPIVKTMDGEELQGSLIGYSHTTDIAVIRIPALAKLEPLPLEEKNPVEIGEEVIALGSPHGFENTATLGNISGVDRTFVIDPFQYNGIYQTSAPIAPGSSGGPLLSKKTGKVIAINSARHTEEVNIGFSIPIYHIIKTINEWISSPMTEDEMTSLFYYQEGVYYYHDYMDDSGYFEGGIYNKDYFEYYEIPFDESWYEGDEDNDDSGYGSDETDETNSQEDYESYETDENSSQEDYKSYETEETNHNKGYRSYETEETNHNKGYRSYETEETNHNKDYKSDKKNKTNQNEDYGSNKTNETSNHEDNGNVENHEKEEDPSVNENDDEGESNQYEEDNSSSAVEEEDPAVKDPVESPEPSVIDPGDSAPEQPIEEDNTITEEETSNEDRDISEEVPTT